MRIHHLSCGTFCPPARRLVNGHGGLLEAGALPCHVLLIEGPHGLVLVDVGLGAADLRDPPGRIGPTWSAAMRPRPEPGLSALAQLSALGFYAEDVADVVLTHLDFDHAGGLPDFPRARVHVFADEHEAAMAPRTFKERFRYKPAHWAHGPEWVRYALAGEAWYGFDAVRSLDDGDVEILLIPLPGHTRGHCGVAVREGERWLLHAGDAYFARQELEAGRHAPPITKGYERLMQTDRGLRVANQRRLQALHRAHPEVRIICSHDAEELAACQAQPGGPGRADLLPSERPPSPSEPR